MLSQSLVNPLQASMGGLKKFGAGFSSYLSLLWYASDATATSTKSRVGPSGAFASAGAVCNGAGGTVAANVPAIHTIDSRKLMWNGPAYSNLFTGGPTGAEAKTLTVQKYCLQCVGGSVATSGGYGTATPSTPLVFTGPAGSVTFTPTDCTTWMLTAAGGYVFPYIGPGISSASAAGTTGLNGTTFPMNFNTVAGQRLLETFRGVPDGTEVWSNASASGTNWALAGSAWTHTAGDATAIIDTGKVVTGKRYLAHYAVTRTAGSVVAKAGSTGTGGATIAAAGTYKEELTCAGSTDMTFVPSNDFAGSVTVLSIQKLNPAVGTVAVLVRMGTSDAEIPDSFDIPILTCTNSVAILRSRRVMVGYKKYTSSSDGLNEAELAGNITWSANEYHLKLVEYNGTKFRVGNRRYSSAMVPINAGIVWSHATLAGGVTFDGSFNPLTALIEAFSITVPHWTASIATWRNKVATEAEVIAELHRKYPIGA